MEKKLFYTYSSVCHKAFKFNELIPVLEIKKGIYTCIQKKNVPECLYVIMSIHVRNINFEKLERLKYLFKKSAYHLPSKIQALTKTKLYL